MYYEKYYTELGLVLENRSVDLLERFVLNKECVRKKAFYQNFLKSNDKYKMATLCKLICNHKEVSPETRGWAEKWLKEHKLSQGLLEDYVEAVDYTRYF